MRKVLVVVTIAGVALGLLAWAVTRGMTSKVGGEWPLGLGAVKDVPLRHPSTPSNAAADELARLALAMQIDFRDRSYSSPPDDVFRAYLLAQAARPDAVIDPPPPEVAEGLAKHAVALAAVREHLIRSEPVLWLVDLRGSTFRGPSMRPHLVLNRVLTASALDRARRGDAGAWDDLHATWKLAKPLLERPELVSVLVGFSITRILNAVARKMPLPEPAWLGEVRSYDYRRAIVAGQQIDAWYVREYSKAEHQPPASSPKETLRNAARVVAEPYYRLAVADILENLRLGAVEVVNSRDCAFDGAAFSDKQQRSLAPWNDLGQMAMANYGPLWARLFRFRAELEATERANALRRGIVLPKTSACADGEWVAEPNGFRFSREIGEPDGVIVPLSFTLAGQGGQVVAPLDGRGPAGSQSR